MPFYQRLGEVPHKRHTQFRQPDGSLYAEQLFSTEGFSSQYSLLYHCHPPTEIIAVAEPKPWCPLAAEDQRLRPRSFQGWELPSRANYLLSREVLLFNQDCSVQLAAPRQSMEDYFYKNADGDELLFVHRGSGHLLTPYGVLPFGYGDYLSIPRGTIYQIRFDEPDNRLLVLESLQPLRIPRKYLSEQGQLLESAPYCERDIRVPELQPPQAKRGDFLIQIKKQGMLHPIRYATHPFDVVGWDGCCYPFAFSIHDFEPITGRIHQPPPVHLTFESSRLVVCSFCPRKFDYHPLSIPAPYNHSNIDSDELLYYVEGDFMSRKGVKPGQLTLHPGGIPHGPHPGAVERSIGAETTEELAVMIDTFAPLRLARMAPELEDPTYVMSWAE